MHDNMPRVVELMQPITLKVSVKDFRIIADALRPLIRKIMLGHGAMNPATVRYLLRRQGIDIDLEATGVIMQGFGEPDIVMVDPEQKLYGIPGQTGKTATYPAVTDYATAYLDLYTRWQAVRANPNLLDLTDEYIDALHNPSQGRTVE